MPVGTPEAPIIPGAGRLNAMPGSSADAAFDDIVSGFHVAESIPSFVDPELLQQMTDMPPVTEDVLREPKLTETHSRPDRVQGIDVLTPTAEQLEHLVGRTLSSEEQKRTIAADKAGRIGTFAAFAAFHQAQAAQAQAEALAQSSQGDDLARKRKKRKAQAAPKSDKQFTTWRQNMEATGRQDPNGGGFALAA